MRVLAILIFMCAAFNTIAAEYYVNFDSGVDGGGSVGSPWNNLNSARKSSGTVSDGDTVYVWGTSTGVSLTLTSSDGGSSGNSIVYIKRPGYDAIIDGDSSVANCFAFENDTNYITIDGFEIRNFTNSAASFTAASTTECKYITIQNCSIHDIAGYGSVHTGNGDVHNLSILNNTIVSVGTTTNDHGIYLAEGEDITISGNSISLSSGNGIEINTRYSLSRVVDGLIIEKNALFDNGTAGAGNGIIILDNGNAVDGLVNVIIKNNFIWDNIDAGINFRDQDSITNCIYNNTIYSNGEWGIEFSGTPEPITRNNIIYDNVSGVINNIGAGTQSNNLSSNPPFLSVDDASSDFLKLSPSALLYINAGYSVPVSDDYFGTLRDGNIDIGAYEYATSATPTASGVSISGGTLQ